VGAQQVEALDVSKYRLERDTSGKAWLSLTPRGRLREFAAGALGVTPWLVAALAIIFLPDVLGRYNDQAHMVRAVWWTAGAILTMGVLIFGLRSALWTVGWELDPRRGVIRRHGRTILGRPMVNLELPMDVVRVLEDDPSRVSILVGGADTFLLARARFGQEELAPLRQQLQDVIAQGAG
jgi:hypothetical protein